MTIQHHNELHTLFRRAIIALVEAVIAAPSIFSPSLRHKREVKRHNEQLEAETMRKAEEKRLRKQQKRLAHK